jgi:serine/threonine-protein kinase HipA
VEQFKKRHPDLDTLQRLLDLIRSYPNPLEFSIQELDYRDESRATTLVQVTEFLIGVQAGFAGSSETSRLDSTAYETTWERIAKAVRDHVDGTYQYETFQKLAVMLLMTYAMRNADCHSKNLALLYTSREDARLAPVYDFFTTSVYTGYRDNPPGIGFMGRKTWLPGKTLAKFIAANFNIPEREQKEMVERISDAIADTAPAVREMMNKLAWFKDTGKRMLATWSDGVKLLREQRMYALNPWKSNEAFEGISDPPKPENPQAIIGRSELLSGPRKRKVK